MKLEGQGEWCCSPWESPGCSGLPVSCRRVPWERAGAGPRTRVPASHRRGLDSAPSSLAFGKSLGLSELINSFINEFSSKNHLESWVVARQDWSYEGLDILGKELPSLRGAGSLMEGGTATG